MDENQLGTRVMETEEDEEGKELPMMLSIPSLYYSMCMNGCR